MDFRFIYRIFEKKKPKTIRNTKNPSKKRIARLWKPEIE